MNQDTRAAIEMTECDRLAANPPDPDRVAPGVPREAVDLPRAIAACRAAVAAAPEAGRLIYQLGRCLFYAGDRQEAFRCFEQAAAMGYRQAHFVLGLVMTRKFDGLPHDIDRIEFHWRAAARLNHASAQVSYVRDALRGHYDHIPERSSREEMLRFLAHAKDKVDYLGGLLVEDLIDALKSRA
jgi:tetratricopeptide (TPR) repeat protein